MALAKNVTTLQYVPFYQTILNMLAVEGSLPFPSADVASKFKNQVYDFVQSELRGRDYAELKTEGERIYGNIGYEPFSEWAPELKSLCETYHAIQEALKPPVDPKEVIRKKALEDGSSMEDMEAYWKQLGPRATLVHAIKERVDAVENPIAKKLLFRKLLREFSEARPRAAK